MSYVKYSKTSTFLFPLLEIPKGLFYCNIKNSFGKTIMTTRFVNSFIEDSDLNIVDYNDGPYVFVVIKSYQDLDFDTFYATILSYSNYVDEYQKLEFIVMVFKIPDSNIEDYHKVMNGQYSEISMKGKNLIMANSYFSGKPSTIPLILHKSEALKNTWEERLSFIGPDIDSPADLGDQEVWPIISDISKYNNEVLNIDKMKIISKKYTALEIESSEDEHDFKNMNIWN